MTNTIPNVPRDDLDLIRAVLEGFKPCIDDALRTVRALLSAPSPAGADGLEVSISSEQILEVFERNGFRIEPGASFSARGQIAQLLNAVGEIERLSDAQAIIGGLRGEADQQAQRIGELASHLEFAVTLLTVAGLAGNAQVEAMRSALSAGVGRVK